MQLDIWTGEGAPPDRLRGAVIAIGNFDGVHLGHKALLGAARDLARRLGRPLGALTFEPHPRSFFRPDAPVFRLSSAEIRRELLAAEGCAAVAELPFDRALASMEAADFVQGLLIGCIEASGVATGLDFAFGKGRGGDAATLAKAFGDRAIALAPVLDAGGAVVSSSRIRNSLRDGDIAAANAWLGHRWRVRAVVAHGDKRGRLLGFPTANMILPPETGLRHGIYAVRARLDGEWRPAVASFGRRPTFDDGAPRLETFIFDFSGDLYGQALDIEFAGWIRGELKFDGVDALVSQMALDAAEAKRLLA